MLLTPIPTKPEFVRFPTVSRMTERCSTTRSIVISNLGTIDPMTRFQIIGCQAFEFQVPGATGLHVNSLATWFALAAACRLTPLRSHSVWVPIRDCPRFPGHTCTPNHPSSGASREGHDRTAQHRTAQDSLCANFSKKKGAREKKNRGPHNSSLCIFQYTISRGRLASHVRATNSGQVSDDRCFLIFLHAM